MGDPNKGDKEREAKPTPPPSATDRVLASLSAASETFSRDAAAAVEKFEREAADQAAGLDARAAELEERATKLRRSELALKVARQSFASHQRSLATKRREEQKYVLALRNRLIEDFAAVQQKLDASQRLADELSDLQDEHDSLQRQCRRAEKRLYNLRLHIASTPRENSFPGHGISRRASVNASSAAASIGTGLKRLPDAVLLDVFSFLDVFEMTRVSLTSRTLHTRCNALFKAPSSPIMIREERSTPKSRRVSIGPLSLSIGGRTGSASGKALARKERRQLENLQARVTSLEQQLQARTEQCHALKEAAAASQQQIETSSRSAAEAHRQLNRLELQSTSDHEVISFMDGRIRELEARDREHATIAQQLRNEIAMLKKSTDSSSHRPAGNGVAASKEDALADDQSNADSMAELRRENMRLQAAIQKYRLQAIQQQQQRQQ